MTKADPDVALPPKRWKGISWEEMARENPLFAVMTRESMADASADDFAPEHRDELFRKGRKLYRKHLRRVLARSPDPRETALVVEYGCGVGRILSAVAEDGWRCAGIDISQTMLDHCRELAPRTEALYILDADNRCAMPDAQASVVYSFAVVQHIASLSTYLTAFDEMCRILKPSGILAVQLNCKDFEGGDLDNPGRTENFESHSLHFRPGEAEPYLEHPQNQWSGVYIGSRLLTEALAERGVIVERWYHHNPAKLMAVWLVARKAPTFDALTLDASGALAASEGRPSWARALQRRIDRLIGPLGLRLISRSELEAERAQRTRLHEALSLERRRLEAFRESFAGERHARAKASARQDALLARAQADVHDLAARRDWLKRELKAALGAQALLSQQAEQLRQALEAAQAYRLQAMAKVDRLRDQAASWRAAEAEATAGLQDKLKAVYAKMVEMIAHRDHQKEARRLALSERDEALAAYDRLAAELVQSRARVQALGEDVVMQRALLAELKSGGPARR